MRVQDPVKYAELLLSIERPNEGYTEDRIRRLFGREEQDIQFPAPIPVHLTYQTAFVDDDGQLITRPDIYGLDSRVLALIKTERGMIDVASKERNGERAAAGSAAAAGRAGSVLLVAVRRRQLRRPHGPAARPHTLQNPLACPKP
jgi:hypothetical protein